MKTITNKAVKYTTQVPDDHFIKMVDKEIETDYFKLIIEACNKASDPQKGFTYDDIKQINRVKDRIENGGDSLYVEFEDADFEFIKKRVVAQTWRIADIQFNEFVDYITGIN